MRTKIALGLILGVLAMSPAFAAEGDIGRVKSVTGTANIIRGGPKAAPIAAAPGMAVRKDDIIQTKGKDSSVGITFIDNSRFSVGPDTRLSLAKFEYDRTTRRGEFLTKVDKGKVAISSGYIAKQKDNRDAMKVETPVSLLAARGTEFVVEVP